MYDRTQINFEHSRRNLIRDRFTILRHFRTCHDPGSNTVEATFFRKLNARAASRATREVIPGYFK